MYNKNNEMIKNTAQLVKLITNKNRKYTFQI